MYRAPAYTFDLVRSHFSPTKFRLPLALFGPLRRIITMADHPHVLAGSRACATREMDPNELRRLLRTRPTTTVPLPVPEAPADDDTWSDVTSVAAPDAATLAALAEGSDVAAVVVSPAHAEPTDEIPSLARSTARWPLRAALMIGLAFAILATQL